MPARVAVEIEGRSVQVRTWQFLVKGIGGYEVPVYLLDTDLPENSAADRTLTHYLYGGDSHYRLCQEVILGIGGVRVLRALGHARLTRFHMNEGHAALLTLELLREQRALAGRERIEPVDLASVHDQCVFTTHTPVAAGHDQFPLELVEQVLGSREACGLYDPVCHQGQLNMTFLALSFSRFINGVAKKHGEVARHLFAGYKIDAITNGVHAPTWVSPELATLFDRHIPGWRSDNFSLRSALSIPYEEIWQGHVLAKNRLLAYIERETNAGFDSDVLTIGFARRATAYKRLDLIFDDLDRLKRIARDIGRLQFVFGGKAHPRDEGGKQLIQHVMQLGRGLGAEVPVVFLPNYDMELAQMMTAGVDLWLNTPEPPLEASGTSGMKAAINGVPSLRVLDGWWIEGCIEGVTGWSVGNPDQPDDRTQDARTIYDKLETIIVPTYYGNRRRYLEVMRTAMALNGSYFNTQRMLAEHVLKAYFE